MRYAGARLGGAAGGCWWSLVRSTRSVPGGFNFGSSALPCAVPLTERLHLVALSLWLGALLSVSAVAAVAFPTMKSLQPALPGFRVNVLEHASIAAGHVMNPAFLALMIGGIALATSALLAWRTMSGPRRVLGVLSLALTAATLAALGLPMRTHLDTYWSAARAGEVEAAESAKKSFDALHPWSSRALGTQALLVSISIGLAAFSRPRAAAPAEPRP